MTTPRFTGSKDYISWTTYYNQGGPHPDTQYDVSRFQRFITMLVWLVSFCVPIVGPLVSWLLLCLTGSRLPYARFHAWHALLFSLTSIGCIALFLLASAVIIGIPYLFGYLILYVAVLFRGLWRIKNRRVTGYYTMLMTSPWVLRSHTASCREMREMQEAHEEQQVRKVILEQAAQINRPADTTG